MAVGNKEPRHESAGAFNVFPPALEGSVARKIPSAFFHGPPFAFFNQVAKNTFLPCACQHSVPGPLAPKRYVVKGHLIIAEKFQNLTACHDVDGFIQLDHQHRATPPTGVMGFVDSHVSPSAIRNTGNVLL